MTRKQILRYADGYCCFRNKDMKKNKYNIFWGKINTVVEAVNHEQAAAVALKTFIKDRVSFEKNNKFRYDDEKSLSNHLLVRKYDDFNYDVWDIADVLGEPVKEEVDKLTLPVTKRIVSCVNTTRDFLDKLKW